MIRKKCEECGGKIVRKKVEYTMYSELIGKFPAEVCKKCGEIVFDEETADEITALIKKKGLYGLESETSVGMAGNSLDLRVNKRIAKFLGLKKGEEVMMYPESKRRLIVEIPQTKSK